MKAYKLFRVKKDKLYPLYVLASQVVSMNEWLTAEEGPRNASGQVKSRRGGLAFRPGFHCCNVPLADHIGKKTEIGNLYQAADTVWCEVEISDTVDYTVEAQKMGIYAKTQYLKYIPKNGFYLYKTNARAKAVWYICGEMKVNRILSNYEVKLLCKEAGMTAQITEAEYKASLK